MTKEHVQKQLRSAIIRAVELGWQRVDGASLVGVQSTAASYAEMMVLPAVEAFVSEAVEGAVRAECAPWATLLESDDGDAVKTIVPDVASPFLPVWLGGAMTALGSVADKLGVKVDLEPGDSVGIDSGADLVDAIVRSILGQALMQQRAAG
jgi:hypothetical protein